MKLEKSLHADLINTIHTLSMVLNNDVDCQLDWDELSNLNLEAKRLENAYDRWVCRKVLIAEEKLRRA
jgi:hypothetical protein